MKLEYIYNQLKYGELKQLYEGSWRSPEGCFTEDALQSLWFNTWMGLEELYKRFLIHQGTWKMDVVEGTTLYPIAPPSEDFLKVEYLYDSNGKELQLNDIDDETSFFTPKINQLQIPEDYAKDHSFVKIVYRARHEAIAEAVATSVPETVEIDMPETYLEALLKYIASRMLAPVGVMEGYHEGDSYWQKFEDACRRIQDHGVDNQRNHSTSQFVQQGWA